MKFKIYTVKIDYLNELRKIDSKVQEEHLKDGKKNRPYIGVLVVYNKHKYIIPLASPKNKHLKMSDTLDFIRINDGIYGAMNLNNMIPVCEGSFVKLEIEKEDTTYKKLLYNQLRWINQTINKNKIIDNVNELRLRYEQKTLNRKIYKRCCHFFDLEKVCKEYSLKHLDLKLKNEFQNKDFILLDDILSIPNLLYIENGIYSKIENFDKNNPNIQNIIIYAKDEFGQEKNINVNVKIKR